MLNTNPATPGLLGCKVALIHKTISNGERVCYFATPFGLSRAFRTVSAARSYARWLGWTITEERDAWNPTPPISRSR